MLRIRAVKKLRDFTLDVDIESDNGTVVLMGNNGSGKTTVLNMVAGIVRPDAGVIKVKEKTFFDSETGIDVPIEDRNVGYVFQNYALFPHLSVYDNVAFGLRMRKAPHVEVRERVKAELEGLGMWELRNAKASRLSGGQKQKVALARCLAARPSLLLMDEPLSALDAETQAWTRSCIKEHIRDGHMPAIIVTHSLADAIELGDMVFIMDRGRVAASGRADEMLKNGSHKFINSFFR
ncbi:ABC transporter ATP-binding protein [Methanocella conradii]|uniref:ABC transporter ATP-binding protein n=1 Tax=Methanocella conradii TaxID=1175444 RepID=UPI00157BE1CC|nr:ABC transporter ATP-binding protein [Methanocella conradii]